MFVYEKYEQARKRHIRNCNKNLLHGVIEINVMGFFYIGSDRVSGVPKAAKYNQNCTCSKLSITTRLQ
jgi:hypothetical protein